MWALLTLVFEGETVFYLAQIRFQFCMETACYVVAHSVFNDNLHPKTVDHRKFNCK